VEIGENALVLAEVPLSLIRIRATPVPPHKIIEHILTLH